MSDTLTLQPLAGTRHEAESDKAVIACNDYLRLGAGRSLYNLYESYRAQSESKTSPEKPSSRRLATLKGWSSKFGWVERATQYDAEYEARKEERRQQVMNDRLALDFERVLVLQDLAAFLLSQIYEQVDGSYPNLWLPDVKQIGSGENAERVDIERFNAAIISELRGTLDDLAKETGGRLRRTDVTSGGKPISLSADQLAAIDEQAETELEAFGRQFYGNGNGSHE